MLSNQTLATATAIQRKMYTSLTEVADLTDQLSQAVDRRDQVSVRMFLSMRQEEIDQLTNCKAILHRQCAELPPEDGALLHQLLTGKVSQPPTSPDGQALLQQVERNRTLLERVCRADQAVSRRLGGPTSYYAKNGK